MSQLYNRQFTSWLWRWKPVLTFAVAASIGGFGNPCARAALRPPSPEHVYFGHHSGACTDDFDPQAIRLLADMVDTYRRMAALDQKSVFDISAPTGPPDGAAPLSAQPDHDETVIFHLRFERPNRLSMEISQPGLIGRPRSIQRWICDGKSFWSFDADANTYTREEAPAKLRNFDRLYHFGGASLELAMLMGMDPFAEVKDQMDSVYDEGATVIQSIKTEVIALRTTSDAQTSTTRLCIGSDDHLLHRFSHESVRHATPTGPSAVGDPLDGLLKTKGKPASPAPRPDEPPQTTKIAYDNLVEIPPEFDAATFWFRPPPGATRQFASSEPTGPKGKALKDVLAALRRKRIRPRRIHH